MLWDKNKIELIEGEGSLTAGGQRQGRRRGLRGRRGGRSRPARWRCRSPASSSAAASSTPGAPGRCPSGRSGSPSSAPAPRARDRLRLRPLRHRGAADRDARPDPPGRGQGHGQSRRARLQETGHRDLHRRPGRERRGRRGLGQVQLRRQERRGRLPLHRRRPRAPTSRALGLEEAGVELEENGKVKVDEYQRDPNPKVYAIGDLSTRRRSPTRPPRRASSRSRTPPASRPTRSTRT